MSVKVFEGLFTSLGWVCTCLVGRLVLKPLGRLLGNACSGFRHELSEGSSRLCTILVLLLILVCPSMVHSTELEDLNPGAINPPAQTVAIDSRGVDMISGMHKVAGMRVAIGSGDSRLVSDPGRSRFNLDNHVGTIEKILIRSTGRQSDERKAHFYSIGLPVGQYYKVDVAGTSEILSVSSGSSATGDGGSINCAGTFCTYTNKNGMIAIFDMSLTNDHQGRGYGDPSNFYVNDGLVSQVTQPDGEVLDYYYRRHGHYTRNGEMYDMPSAVVSSLGWMLKYYDSDVIYGENLRAYGDRSITAINTRLEYCDYTAQQCEGLSHDWPVASMEVESRLMLPATPSTDPNAWARTNITKVTAPGEVKSDYHSMSYGKLGGGNGWQTYRTAEGIESKYEIAGYYYNIAYHRYETRYGRGVNKVLSATIAGQNSIYDFTSSPIVGPDGTYEVDYPYNRLSTFTDQLGRETSYEYEGGYKNRINKVVSPDGSYTTYDYDGRGNITYIRKYPAGGGSPLVTKAVYPSCSSTNQKYCNKPSSITDADGATTSYTYYAAHGGVNTITKPTAKVTINGAAQNVRPVVKHYYTSYRPYSYDASGVMKAAVKPIYRLTKVTQCRTASTCSGSSDELVSETHYDVHENLLPEYSVISSGDGGVTLRTDYEYDIYGNQVKASGPHPKDVTYTFYDLQQRVIGSIGPNANSQGRVGTYAEFNADGQVIFTKTGNPGGTDLSALQSMTAVTQTSTDYDPVTGLPEKEVTSGRDVESLVVQKSYDSEFRLECSVIRINGTSSGNACYAGSGSYGDDRVTKYEYDATDALRKVIKGYGTDVAAVYRENRYNSKGQLEKLLDGNGNVTRYDYDAFGRLRKTTFPSKTSAGSVNSSDYTLSIYDGTRVKTLRLRNGTVITFGYDSWGRITSKASASNGAFGAVNEAYGYDNFSNVTSLVNNSTGIASTSVVSSFNALGWKISEQTALGTVRYGYDNYGRRDRLTWPDNFYITYDYANNLSLQSIKQSDSLTLATFGYDTLGRRESLTRANGVTTDYAYDDFSRLSSIETDVAGSDTYDDYAASFDYNPVSQLTVKTVEVRNPEYVFSEPTQAESYTPNGLNQITQWSGQSLAYDTNGNMKKIGAKNYTYNNDNLLTSAEGVSLSYDAAKRLYKVGNICFLYDGADIIAETNCSGTVTDRYVHGPNVDDPIVWYVGAGTGNKRYYSEDRQGSIIGLTSNAGSSYAINSYAEYGVPASTNKGRFQYTGQVWLEEMGLYYYKARFYHPELGRFMQTDPIGYSDQMNLYAYVANDPINFIDPTGMQSEGTCSQNRQKWECIVPAAEEVKERSSSGNVTLTGEAAQRLVRSAQNGPSVMGFIREEGVNVLMRTGQAAGGVGQVALGGGICYGSGGLACVVGAAIAGKGVDNFQAGIRGTDSLTEQALIGLTGSEKAGTIINASFDLGTSVYGLVRSVPKISAYGTEYNASWYKGVPGYFEPAVNQTTGTMLTIEAFSSGATIYSVVE